MHANSREEIEQCYSGDILAGVGLKQTSTGDTLCAPDEPIALEQIVFPEPVIAVAIEPKTKVDQEKLATALQRLSEEDPTFRVESDEETGQTVINGMGELHLEVLVDRMMREFNVEATVGKPQVAYRETIRQEANKVQGKFVRQTGGSRPVRRRRHQRRAEPRRGLRVRLARSRAARSRPSTSPRSRRASSRRSPPGIKAGYPMVDVKVELIDGSYHDVDSSEMAFKIAGSMAIQEAAKRAKPVLLEPVMEVEVVTPEELPRRRDRRPLPAPRQARGPGAARQRARRRARPSRSARCSATSATCARRPRAARPTRCSSPATRKCRRSIAEEIVEHKAATPAGAAS